jgi:hypothetical protein
MSEQTQKPMFLNRRQRRNTLKQKGILKTISRMSFFSEAKTKIREQNREQGRQIHEAWLDHVEKQQAGTLEQKLESMKKTWESIGYNAEEISKLEEAWALTTIKDKETWKEDKKKARLLMRDAAESKAKR